MDNLRLPTSRPLARSRVAIHLAFTTLILALLGLPSAPTQAETSSPMRRVNVPFATIPPAVFWFGEVDRTSNHADVRVSYSDVDLRVVVHIIDRLLWNDPAEVRSALTDWDAVTVVVDVDGNTGLAPDANTYRFVIQANCPEGDFLCQAGYVGSGSPWVKTQGLFTGTTEWRGNGFNDDLDDKGWQAYFTVPFSSLGLDGPPPDGTMWGLSVVIHDRDDAAGTAIPDRFWPETMQPDVPATWGQMVFGLPGYAPPLAMPQGSTTIRQGLNGATVVDGHAGGHTTCGDGLDHWTEWGEANYAGYEQINIQNQWDIADYPCFSKYYVTFPLDALPQDKVIIAATLTMHLFGNAGGGEWGEPPDSYIQVLTVDEAWDEATLSWNSAPLAMENIMGTWVHPVLPGEEAEPHPYQWYVGRAVAWSIAQGEPLRLALYSADGPRHTGKYFWSSDVGDWNASGRPTLTVVWGEPCDSPGVECAFIYLPLVTRPVG